MIADNFMFTLRNNMYKITWKSIKHNISVRSYYLLVNINAAVI